MATSPHIYWTTPVSMLVALLVGFLFSLGHHLFYASLASKPAPTGAYSIAGTNISKQQFNTAVGTSFAFLVKAALALAIGIAYTQVFWRAVRVSKKGATLASLDTTYSALSTASSFFRLHVWWKHPLLFLLAVIAWSIPIASIVTPATLSIETARVNPLPSSMESVPQLDFVSFNYLNNMQVQPSFPSDDHNATASDWDVYCYNGPSQVVSRVANSVSSFGQILPITPPAANASWTLDFWGPSIQCNDVVDQRRAKIWANLYDYVSWGNSSYSQCNTSPAYLSWVSNSTDNPIPFPDMRNSTDPNQAPPAITSRTLQYAMPASIYVAVVPRMFELVTLPTHEIPGGCQLVLGGGASFFNSATLLQCDFVNSSISAAFEFVNGAQNITVTSNASTTSSSPVTPLECVTGPIDVQEGRENGTESYFDNFENATCSTLNTNGQQCSFDSGVVQTLAYQSVVQAFTSILLGTIGLTPETSTIEATTVAVNSGVFDTVLMDTAELGFIDDYCVQSSSCGSPNLQEYPLTTNATEVQGLSSPYPVGSRGNLREALEAMFQNITISLLSEQYLQPNFSSQYAPPATRNVTFLRYHNVYTYSSQTLWIAYGIAIAVTALTVGVGITALLLTGASFNNNFSTVLRVGRTAIMTEDIRGTEGEGYEPLPKHLSRARVLLPSNRPASSQASMSTADGVTKEGPDITTVDSSLLHEDDLHASSRAHPLDEPT